MPKQNHHKIIENLKRYFYYFMVFAFLGWVWEVIICLIKDGQLENPGTLRGPWVPIYGFGMVAVVFIGRRMKKWWQLFIVAGIVSGVFEYLTAVALETMYSVRWWDYSDFLLNFQGRVCIEVLVVFAALACALYYLFLPLLDKLYNRYNGRAMTVVLAICLACIVADFIYALVVGPNTGHIFMLQ